MRRNTSNNHINISRDELYEQVWSQPISMVANNYGLLMSGLLRYAENLKSHCIEEVTGNETGELTELKAESGMPKTAEKEMLQPSGSKILREKKSMKK